MARGKDTCRILKKIRRQIAEANDIEFITSECRYKGDCTGTCPKCEAEVSYLEQQLQTLSLSGKAIAIAGISAGALVMSLPLDSIAEIYPDTSGTTSISAPADTLIIKGTVVDSVDVMIGATVYNLNRKTGVSTDIHGNFKIMASRGDSLEFSFIGYNPKTIQILDASKPLNIILKLNTDIIMGEQVVTKEKRPKRPSKNTFRFRQKKKK